MRHRRVLSPLILLCLLPVLARAKCPQPTPGDNSTYPNVILLVADDMSWDDLPYFNPEIGYGEPNPTPITNRRVLTNRRPALNRYAARSLARQDGDSIWAENLAGDPVTTIDQPSGVASYVHDQACTVLEPTSCVAMTDVLGGLRTTPGLGGLRRLAESATFSRFYAASSVCSPSRASILTGLHVGPKGTSAPNLHPVSAKYLDLRSDFVTIAEYLKQGCPDRCPVPGGCANAPPCYRTALFGKWHLGEKESQGETPLGQGFDEFLGFLGGERGYFNEEALNCTHVCNVAENGSCRDPSPCDQNRKWSVPHEDSSNEQQRECWNDGKVEQTKCTYQDRIFRDFAVDFVERQEAAQSASPEAAPYFLMVTFHAPHAALAAPARTVAHYTTGSTSPPAPLYGGGSPAEFWAMIEEMDFAVGEILDAAGSNTVVMFTSDHGRPRGAYGVPTLRGGKGGTYDGGLRVGLLARACDSAPPNDLDEFVAGHADILPTIAEAVRLCLDGTGAPCVCGDAGCPELGFPGVGNSFWNLINRDSSETGPTARADYVVSRYNEGKTIVTRPRLFGSTGGVCATTAAALPQLPRALAGGAWSAGSCETCDPDGDGPSQCSQKWCTIPGPAKVCVKKAECNGLHCEPGAVNGQCTKRTDCPQDHFCKASWIYKVRCNSCAPAAWKLRKTTGPPRELFDTVTNPSEERRLNCRNETQSGPLQVIQDDLNTWLDAELNL